MKLTLFVAFFSVSAFACIDPPTPISLGDSTFSYEQMEISSAGLRVASGKSKETNGRFYFDQEHKKWCFRELGKKAMCNLKRQMTFSNPATSKITAVATFDNKRRTITIKQVKKPFSSTSFEVDTTANYMRITDKSDPVDEKNLGSYTRYIATGHAANGRTLGSVTSESLRYAKALGGGKKKPLDLTSVRAFDGGCGSAQSSDEKAATKRHSP